MQTSGLTTPLVVLISGGVIALAIILSPIFMQQYKMSQCASILGQGMGGGSERAVKTTCIQYVYGG